MCDANVEPAVFRVLYAYMRSFPFDYRMLTHITLNNRRNIYYHSLVYIDNILLIILRVCTVNSTDFKDNSPNSI